MTEARADIEGLLPPAGRRAAEVHATDLSLHGEHPVIRLPFNVVVHGRSFVGNGLSIVGADATGLIDPQLHGRVLVVTLVFNFPGYSISLPVDAAIGTGAPESGTISFRFLEPTGPHLAQLRYILNSYVGGDLVGVDGLLSAAGRGPGPRVADAPRVEKSVLRSAIEGLRWGALAGVGLLLVGFVGVKLYERLFVAPVAGLSTITLEGMDLRAVSAGQLDFVNPAARKGDIAFAIRTTSGEVLAVSMPCDCVVAPGSAQAGATVLAGDTVMTVAPADAPVVVSTQVDSHGLKMLASGAHAEVRMPDGTLATAALDPTDLPGLLRTVTDTTVIPVDLLPTAPIPSQSIGLPVDVLIKADPLAEISRFFSLNAKNLRGQQ